MGWFGELWRRLLFLFQRNRMAKDLADEMRLHLDLRAEERTAEGMEHSEAEARARRAFGNVTKISEQGRGAWGWTFLESLANDLRYAVRALRADPGFALAAAGSLALGIGANTAIFSILNAVILRSLPVEDPQRLVQLKMTPSVDGDFFYTNPIWEEVRDHQQAFSGALAYGGGGFDLAKGGESHFANGILVSGDFFRVLGVPAIRGPIDQPAGRQTRLRSGWAGSGHQLRILARALRRRLQHHRKDLHNRPAPVSSDWSHTVMVHGTGDG